MSLKNFDPKDVVRLRHMLDAAEECLTFTRGKGLSSFKKDRKLFLAVIKELEIIGEAAGRVSKEVTGAHPEIPWVEITGTRNRLIHAYFDVAPETIWNTVEQSLPGLVKSLKTILKE